MSAKINILKVNEFESSNLVASTPKPLGKQGGRSVSVNYRFPEGQSILTIQTPWMRSYGINKWFDEKNPDAPPKLSVTLSFLGVESDSKIKEIQDFLEKLDNWAIDTAHKNSWEWLKVKNTPRDTLAFNYNPSFKIPKDEKTGEPTGKPAYMKLKVNLNDNGYNLTFFDKDRQIIPTDDVESTFIKGSRVKALIQCTGVWVVNGKFGLTWNLKQMILDPPSRIGKEYAFCDDEDEETPATTQGASSSAPLPTPRKQEIIAEELSNSDDDEEDLPEKSQAVKKIVRKVVSAKK